MLPRRIAIPLMAVGFVLVAAPLTANPATHQPHSIKEVTPETITLRVRNEFRWEVTVQLVTKSGRTVDLGPVASGTDLVAQIAESVLDGSEPVRLKVKSTRNALRHLGEPLVNDDTVVSRLFAAQPGVVVEMHVGQELSDSRVWVHRG